MPLCGPGAGGPLIGSWTELGSASWVVGCLLVASCFLGWVWPLCLEGDWTSRLSSVQGRREGHNQLDASVVSVGAAVQAAQRSQCGGEEGFSCH